LLTSRVIGSFWSAGKRFLIGYGLPSVRPCRGQLAWPTS
jgi:hypothetical protein